MTMEEINPIYFIPIFIVLWIGVLSLVSLLGGWFRLAKKFPLSQDTGIVLQKFFWKSINLNYLAGYGNCINIEITDKGLILKPSLIISVLHKPIFLTWLNISNLELKKGFIKWVIFRVGKSRLVIYGKVAIAIHSAFSKYRIENRTK